MYMYDFVMPVTGAIFVLAVIIVLLIVASRVYQAHISAVDRRSFEAMAEELKAENAYLKAELAIVKDTVLSIDKMMKEIE